MKVWDCPPSKKIKIFLLSGLSLLIIYLVLSFFFFEKDPLIQLFSIISDRYLSLIEKFANILLHRTGSPVIIQKHFAFLNGVILEGFSTKLMYGTPLLFFVLMILLIRSSVRSKIFFSGLILLVCFLFGSVTNAVGAYAAVNNSSIVAFQSIPHSLGYLCFITIILAWYLKNKKSVIDIISGLIRLSKLKGLSELPGNPKFLHKKMLELFFIIYAYIIVSKFAYNFFEFRLWIEFLFRSAQGILSLAGYEAIVEHSLLIGGNGSIYMEDNCLGILTMFLFASLVYLTGNDNKTRWIYIISGIILLNFVNILRFVLLFIHIQKHGAYILAMDLHDMYNYIIYGIVFVLWVIWFEFFADMKVEGKG